VSRMALDTSDGNPVRGTQSNDRDGDAHVRPAASFTSSHTSLVVSCQVLHSFVLRSVSPGSHQHMHECRQTQS
jgi:hypothetical protein